jgi:hypothetical protein
LILNGYVADHAGLPTAWQLAGLLSMLSIPCYLALRTRADESEFVQGVAK